MFKEYEREYEKVYTDNKRNNRKCKLEQVSPYNSNPQNTALYIEKFRKEAREFDLDTFGHIVKLTWLSRRFCYGGKRRVENRRNGVYLDGAFGVFMRYYVGHDTKFVTANRETLVKVASYLDDFFPNFDEGDPFCEDYAYPFEHLSLSCLVVVYQMDERLDILRACERRKLTYSEFLDYVINYIECLNAELGKRKYELIHSNHFMIYVKKMIK